MKNPAEHNGTRNGTNQKGVSEVTFVETKKYLQQPGILNKTIEIKMQQLHELKEKRFCIQATDYSKDKVQSSVSGDSLEKLISKIVDLDREIDSLIDSYVDLKWEIISKIEKLPKKQREVLLLKYIDGCSISEMAFELNLATSRVKQITNDAILNFSKMLDKTGQA